jgi:tetratricopeptide (TPR) repeat protein
MRSNNNENAIKDFQKALELSKDVDIHSQSIFNSNIGNCYLYLSKYDEALKYINTALKLNPDNSHAQSDKDKILALNIT